MTARFRILLAGRFRRDDIRVEVVPSTRKALPAVESAIEAAWQKTHARPGVRLFDGPICRLEDFCTDADKLVIRLSRTSYRILVGTNFCHPEFLQQYGRAVMANAVGVSTGLRTADGYWVMGRRNHSVAYYPGRVHPFAGSIEVAETIDLFDNAERELREELHLTTSEIADTTLVGMAEDLTLVHPEAIFIARTTRSLDAVAAGLDAEEHDGFWSIPDTPDAVAAALTDDELTPVAKAVLLLGGRVTFGDAWFDRHHHLCAIRANS